MARYGNRLVARITHHHETDTLVVGSGASEDLSPLEDVAVCFGALQLGDLCRMIIVDPIKALQDPVLSLTDAMKFLSQNAERLDDEFSLDDHKIRQELRNVSDQFKRAWDKAIEGQQDDLGHSR